MGSVLPKIGKGDDVRALVYDAKQDFTSTIVGIAPKARLFILNPFDARGVAWDMAQDIDSPIYAQQMASILIPEVKNATQPFFADASRHLLTGVIVSLIKNAHYAWTFRDVLLIMKSRERIREALEACSYTSELADEYLQDGVTSNNIMSTIASKLHRYEFIGAVWDKASKSISLKDWLNSESVIILGNDESARSALDAINQVIFKRLTELILAQEESQSRQTWFFLDELRQAGKLEGLSALLTKGRSKGASVVLGFQDIEGLRDVYGMKLANEISGQCSNKAILRCDSSETASWASALFGKREVLEERSSKGSTAGLSSMHLKTGGVRSTSRSRTTSQQIVERKIVMPSEIMNIKPTSPDNGLTGLFITPEIGSYWVSVKWQWLIDHLSAPHGRVRNLVPRKVEDQFLRGWADADDERLNLSFNPVQLPVSRRREARLRNQEEVRTPSTQRIPFSESYPDPH